MSSQNLSTRRIFILSVLAIFLASTTQAYHTGISGDADEKGEIAVAGCTCHSGEPDNSVTVVLDGVPYHYEAGIVYEMKIQLIGGAEIDISSQTGGFSMLVNIGSLSPSEGYENDVQNWEDDEKRLTHSNAGSKTEERIWHFTWTAPESESGVVEFWISGNTVNGDSIPSALDRWNRVTTSVSEGTDDGRTRTVFSGNGEITPPAPTDTHINLHDMGAPLKAHWLGLLGFGAVVLVIIFCGLFLRYGLSHHSTGRSNLLKLRIKHLRRGDQI
jgi:hypothetical protein